MTDKVYIGTKAGSFAEKGAFEPISRVTLWWGESDNEYFTAGDDTGRELEASCPYATQAMADELLLTVKGKAYRPFEAGEAALDPAAEPGDGVTIAGLYSVLAEVRSDAYGLCKTGAPGEKEIDHEYPYLTPEELEMGRKVTLGTPYYGTKITRQEGLTVEKTGDGSPSAKAVLNADELSFYAGNKKVLFFDPVTGTYRFDGAMNVSDNFVVDKSGNVSIKGNINLSAGNISWGDNTPYQSEFAASPNGPWHFPMQSGDLYRRDKFTGDTGFGAPYQFVGRDGHDGSSASVPGYIKSTYIDNARILSPAIYGGHFYATGQGANNEAAYYINDGVTINGASAELGPTRGYISYDTHGKGTVDEARERVIFKTEKIPLKIESAQNLSIDAGGYIHMGSSLHAWGGIVLDTNSYGYSLPGSGTTGQVFYLLEG